MPLQDFEDHMNYKLEDTLNNYQNSLAFNFSDTFISLFLPKLFHLTHAFFSWEFGPSTR